MKKRKQKRTKKIIKKKLNNEPKVLITKINHLNHYKIKKNKYYKKQIKKKKKPKNKNK